jgi:hypothetical protein
MPFEPLGLEAAASDEQPGPFTDRAGDLFLDFPGRALGDQRPDVGVRKHGVSHAQGLDVVHEAPEELVGDGLQDSAAREAMRLPVRVELVKATRSTPGCRTRGSPSPVTMFTAPGGRPSQ